VGKKAVSDLIGHNLCSNPQFRRWAGGPGGVHHAGTDHFRNADPLEQRQAHRSKTHLKPKEVWSIRIRLQMGGKLRELALFNLAIDSKLRSCDLVRLKVSDIAIGTAIKARAAVVQQKTRRPVPFELTEPTREALHAWIAQCGLRPGDFLFPSRYPAVPHLSTRQYARLVNNWVESIGLNPSDYGTRSLRRTKVAQIYRETGNLRAVQLLLGHTKIESTVRYLGIDTDDALRLAEQVEM
jgi:integrase